MSGGISVERQSLRRLERLDRAVKGLSNRVEAFWETLCRDHPWLTQERPGGDVAVRSLFPRSTVGKYQGDPLMRSILLASEHASIAKLSTIEIIQLINKLTDLTIEDPTYYFVRDYF